MQNKKMFITFILLTISWMIFIFVLSGTPANKSDADSKAIVKTVISKKDQSELPKDEIKQIDKKVDNMNHIFRKFAHAGVYLVLSILINITILYINNYKWNIINLLSLIISFIYACSDEFHQSFIPGRSSELTDVLIDTFGALLGCLIFDLVYRIYIERKAIEK